MATINTDPITKVILQGRKNPDGSQRFWQHDIDAGSTVTVKVSGGNVSMQTETNTVIGVTANPAPPTVATPPAAAPTVASMSDAAWYLTTYPDVAAAKMDALDHYARFGWKEGRHPGPKFNTLKYLAAYPTVVGNALLDYVQSGFAAGRTAFPVLPGDPLQRPAPAPAQPASPTPPATPTPTSGTTGRPPKLSGIKINQPYPVGPDSKFNTIIGWAEPIGGIGPWSVNLTNDANGKYRMDNGRVAVSGVSSLGAADDTITIQVFDGRGDSAIGSFKVNKTADGVSGLALNTSNPTYAFSPLVNGQVRVDIAPSWVPVAYGAKHGDVRGDGIGVWVQGSAKVVNGQLAATPHPIWTAGGGSIYARQGGVAPAVGEYPVTITASNPSGDVQFLDVTLKLLPIPTIDYIEFNQQHPVSTATAAGELIGVVAVTTPTDGAPQFSIIDATGTLFVDPVTRIVRVVKPPTKAGPLTFTVHVGIGSGVASANQDYTINVLQGQFLDPSLMTLPVNPDLDNSHPAQVIGTATVKGQTGGIWRVQSQNNFNVDATTGWWPTPARYQVDNTGRVFTGANVLLSYQNPAYGYEQDRITLTWTSDDGATTCTQSFAIPIKEAPETVFYVGKGAVAQYGADKAFETLLEANKRFNRWHPGMKVRLKCLQEPVDQPEYYTDGTRAYETKDGWVGPIAIDVADLTKRPRGGGRSDNTGVSSGITSSGKGFFLFSDGDAELIGWRVADVHGSGGNAGVEGVRKDGNTYGNLAMIDVQIDNCDQGFESGPIHGRIYHKRVVIRRCGGASVGSGLTHNVYCGAVDQILAEDSFYGEALWGHLFKSRAKKTIIRNCRFLDTSSTAAACPLDICNFGDVTIEGNFIEKGPMAANPSAINLGAEGSSADLNLAHINNNTIVVGAMSYGGNYGQCVAVMHYHLPPINNGPPSKIVGDGNKIWLSPFSVIVGDDTANYLNNAPVPPDSTVLTNTTLLTGAPPVMDLTNPTTKQPFQPFSVRPYRHSQILESRQPYPNFNGYLQEVPLQMQVAANAPAGTVVFAGRGVTDIAYAGPSVPAPERFGPGATYAFNMTGSNSWIYGHSANPTPWAPDGAFGLTTNPDGTYTVTYQGGLQPGGYYLRIVGTASSGGYVTDQRVFVKVGTR
jgi:hypothetical protein